MMRILFNSKDLQFKTPFGPVVEGQECTMHLHIPVSCLTVSAKLCLNRENGDGYADFEMVCVDRRDEYEIYEVQFTLEERGLYFYYFRIVTANEAFSLYRQGYDQANMEEGDCWQISCLPPDFTVPDGWAGRVMYQIFPDRFHKIGDCDCTEKLRPFWVHEDVGEVPDYRAGASGEVENCDFYGGNLRGIIGKLDYLYDLGVRVLYLNPIFKAWSNHRYDTADYKKIDEMLGTQADFADLCREAHRRDMKIILDGVFSHTGSRSIYFESACADPDSPFRAWYEFREYPHEYTAWWGIRTLPCVRETDPGFLRYIVEDEDSVIARWMRAGADGFRLDVADELPDEFIEKLRHRLKGLRPDALLIGEVWEDASNKISYGKRRRYFTDGLLDSVMNYPLRQAILDFVCGREDGRLLCQTIMEITENYPPQVLGVLMNMLSTHDTPRIFSLLSPDEPPSDRDARARYRMDDAARRVARDRYRCAALLPFVLPGMPCIYYGDELGSEGFEDPFCRRYFEWDRVDRSDMLPFFKALGRLRNGCEVLQRGSVSARWLGPGAVQIVREWQGQTARITVNVGAEKDLSCTGRIRLCHGIKQGEEGCRIGPYGFLCEIE